MAVFVRNKHTYKGNGEYIGRPSILGNPFSHMPNTLAEFKVATRQEAIVEYRTYFLQKLNDKAFYNELMRLVEIAKHGDLNLICFCHPSPCHGDVIKEWIEGYMKNGLH